jgi:hypothetical protein
VSALANVSFADGYDIITPVTTKDARRVTGVRIQSRTERTEESLDADLVVDATGRGSRAPAWLAAMGYPRVGEDHVKVGLAYTSRRYRWRSDPFNGDMSINPVATPAYPRGAFLYTLGGDLCLLSLFPDLEGRRTVKVRMGNAYMARLLTAAVHDPVLTTAFLSVAGLIDPPPSLMRPSLAARVFRSPGKTADPASPAADRVMAA